MEINVDIPLWILPFIVVGLFIAADFLGDQIKASRRDYRNMRDIRRIKRHLKDFDQTQSIYVPNDWSVQVIQISPPLNLTPPWFRVQNAPPVTDHLGLGPVKWIEPFEVAHVLGPLFLRT